MKKILIADDEPDILKVVKFRLMKAGYEVTMVVNGQEVLDCVKDLKPDLIILDYSMPVMKGDEACQRLKSDPATKDIPILMMTASIRKVGEEEIGDIKADEKILKPFEPDALLEIIKTLIN